MSARPYSGWDPSVTPALRDQQIDRLAKLLHDAERERDEWKQEAERRGLPQELIQRLNAAERDNTRLRERLERWEDEDARVLSRVDEESRRAEAVEARLAQATEALREIHSKPYRAEEVTLRFFAAADSDASEAT